MKRTHKPLTCRVVKGALVIEIGIDTLAWAFLRSNFAYELAGPDCLARGERPDKRFRIDDKLEFARDVVREMIDEAEDGSNLLNTMIDEACKRAIEQGSIAFVDTHEDER